MNREIKRLKLQQEISECKKSIAEKELEIMELEDEELFEEYTEEFETTGSIIPTEFGTHRDINGFKLANSVCKDYISIEYAGGGKIRVGGHLCPVSIDKLREIVVDPLFPRGGIDQRSEYMKTIIGRRYTVDRLLYNYFKGNLNPVIEQYDNEMKTSPLQYNRGQLIF